ncbi:MAG: hypothetical protein ACM3VT_01560 [Solirubrobacterales bacterium]
MGGRSIERFSRSTVDAVDVVDAMDDVDGRLVLHGVHQVRAVHIVHRERSPPEPGRAAAPILAIVGVDRPDVGE